MKIKYRKDTLILFLILFFHIADCFSKEVYSIAFFNYMKNLMMLFFIIYCLIQKKIKNTWFGRDDAKEILLMSVAFLMISIYQMVRNDTFNIVPFVGVFRLLIPLVGAFYSINIFRLEDITRILKAILCISFAAYILDLLLTRRFGIDAFFRLTLSGFNDVSTESDMFSPLSMGLCIYLCANERKNKWKLLSLIFVIMTNKRIMILYAFILFFLGQYLLKNTVKKRLVIVTAIGTVIVTAIYIQMNLQIIDDTIIRKLFNVNLDSFGMGRAWLYRNIYNSNYKSAGFQTLNSTKFVLRGAEMDFPNMYLEMGILAVLVCVYTIFKLIRANAYNYIIVTFVMAEMATSHFIDITYFWIFFYLTIMEINKNQKISIREDYESGEKNEWTGKNISHYSGIQC